MRAANPSRMSARPKVYCAVWKSGSGGAEPEDIAEVVGLLAGPAGRFVTGQTIDVSGGTFLGPIVPA
jgi:NAD(P)-dependent dehydrogenase (short-subunit alcohol dehydrogenase family)